MLSGRIGKAWLGLSRRPEARAAIRDAFGSRSRARGGDADNAAAIAIAPHSCATYREIVQAPTGGGRQVLFAFQARNR
jgi:hypothetical protein